MTTSDTADEPGRPRWSASEAAKRCGVGRATITRRLEAGKIPGAIRTKDGWSIPLEGLLAAGFTPDRPRPPDPAHGPDRSPGEHVRAADQLARRVHELEQQLAAAHVDAERERTRRQGAEQLAADRAAHIDDLRRTLAMLTTAPTPDALVHPAGPTRQRGLLGRVVDRLGL